MARLKQDLDYSIRPMQEKDISQVVEIDREAFPTQWPHLTYASLKLELRNRLARYVVAYKHNEFVSQPVAGRERDATVWDKLKHLFSKETVNVLIPPSSAERLIGMAGFWIMVGEAHITTIAVRDGYRRQGVGERLLVSLIDLALQLNAEIVTLEVRVSNELAQSLYLKYGFCKAGLRHRYYTDNGEDALIMTTHVITSTSFQSRFQELKEACEQNESLINTI